jgi:hypothetical protein
VTIGLLSGWSATPDATKALCCHVLSFSARANPTERVKYYNVVRSRIPEKPTGAKSFSRLILTLFQKRPSLHRKAVLTSDSVSKKCCKHFGNFTEYMCFINSLNRFFYVCCPVGTFLLPPAVVLRGVIPQCAMVAGYHTGPSQAGTPIVEDRGASSLTGDPSTRLRFPARVSIY